tara:strand:- start:157 stop:339 length:183 start_codon:yes stop_codon:yes gene_type:complete
MIKSNLYYRDDKGELRTLTSGDLSSDLELVGDQGKLVTDIISLGMTTPVTPVLCALEGGK